jgi:hypothetical protein
MFAFHPRWTLNLRALDSFMPHLKRSLPQDPLRLTASHVAAGCALRCKNTGVKQTAQVPIPRLARQ